MFTGRMLASMKVTADSRKGVLFFSRSEEARKAAFNNRTRRFFDLSKNELKRIQNVYFRRLTRER
jgi:secreted Zn-dependent insulinase-like peptidase